MNQNEFWWLVPVASFASALVGAGAAFAGLKWRYRADYRRDLLLKLISDIQDAADLATDYWILSPNANGEERAQADRLSYRLIGYQERLEVSIEGARPLLRAIDTLGMEIPWAHFLDQLAGGEFGEPDRHPDGTRAGEVQVAAATLIRELRAASDRKLLG